MRKEKEEAIPHRLASFVLKLKTVGIKLSGSEQIDFLATIHNSKRVLLPYIITDKLYEKIYPFPSADPNHMMMRTYVKNYRETGWKMLRNELKFFNKLLEVEPTLLSMPIRQVLTILDNLENEYKKLVEKTLTYLQTIKNS